MSKAGEKRTCKINLSEPDKICSGNKPRGSPAILGLEIKDRGLVWCGLDVLTIEWEVKTIEVDVHGSTAKISGYSLEYKDGRKDFVESYRVVRIIKTSS